MRTAVPKTHEHKSRAPAPSRWAGVREALAPWLAAALLMVHALAALVTQRLWPLLRASGRAGVRAVNARRRKAHSWWRRTSPRVARGLDLALWWSVWALVVAIGGGERGSRAVAGLARHRLWPGLQAAYRHGKAQLLAGWAWTWPRAQHGARRLTTAAVAGARRLGRACVATAHRLGAATTTRQLGPAVANAPRWLAATADAGVRQVRARRLGRRLAFATGVALLPIATGAALAGPTLEVAARTIDVDVGPPGNLPPLAERSAVVAGDGSELAVLHGTENRRIVPLDDIPEHVRQAVIAAEDHRFYEHDGFDVVAIGRALAVNLEASGVVQGGSTITQQLAKQNFVGDAQSLARKVRELIHAIGLEQELGKDELLERYLNQVYFGSGAYGIGAAAEEFFRAEPDELTVDQAALLAGQIRAPAATDPRANPDTAEARRNQVLAQMAAEGYLDRAEVARLQREPVEVAPRLDRSPTEPYVVEAVKREFLANPAFGESREERLEALFGGGLHIETTLDVSLQTHAHEVVQEHVEALDGPTAALISVEPGTGRVLALSGGGDFEDSKFDVATQSRRQPGSAFKTFALIAALEDGVDLHDRFEGNSPDEHDLPAGQVWQVHNFGGARLGQVELRQALVRSVNTAFAELTLDLGHERVIDVATRLGIAERAFGEPSTHGPAVSLGGLTHGVSPLEMAAAYAALASEGRYAAPFLVERVTGPAGEVVFERDIEPVRAIEPDVAATTLDVLEDAVVHGTGQAAALADWPVAGKTGTTQNSADAWFIGTVPHLATAVWVGHPDERTSIPGLTGGAVSAPLWRDFMTQAVAGDEPTDFAD